MKDSKTEALEAHCWDVTDNFRAAVHLRLAGRIAMNIRNAELHSDPDEREKARVRVAAYSNALNDLNGIFLETTNADR